VAKGQKYHRTGYSNHPMKKHLLKSKICNIDNNNNKNNNSGKNKGKMFVVMSNYNN